jgi:predicted ribosomally synthesized peptide with nif11-like leader
MSEQSAKAFLEKFRTDAAFAGSLRTANTVEDRKAIVKNAGFDFTEAELNAARGGQISDEELEGVAGGGGYMCFDYQCVAK